MLHFLRKINLLWAPLLAACLALLMMNFGQSYTVAVMAAITLWMAIWWTTEAVNIYLTALIPAFAMPLLGILSMKDIAIAYLPQIIFLFIGGFILAFAVEKWNLHKRIAYSIILSLGNRIDRLLLSFMLASYLLSMWILNTATVILLLPAVLAVVGQIKDASERKLYTPFLLGLAFASSIGGIATIIGTAPNMFLMDFYNDAQALSPKINFMNWFLMAFPLSLILFVVCFFLIKKYSLGKHEISLDLDYCRKELKKMGSFSYEESVVASVFVLLIIAWFTARDIPFQSFKFRGWLNLLPEASFVKESTLAILAAFSLFLIPSKQKGKKIADWSDASKVPIGIIFLFGGGFALAKGFEISGLSAIIATQLQVLSNLPLFGLIILLVLFMTFFTEISSNTASTILVLPVLMAMLSKFDFPAAFVLFPVTIAASCAFMLPVATPPNTIVFGSGKLQIRDMLRAGIWLNLASALIISLYTYYVVPMFFGT